ncbi:MAG: hypothetical protein AB1742_02100 [bacterium]
MTSYVMSFTGTDISGPDSTSGTTLYNTDVRTILPQCTVSSFPASTPNSCTPTTPSECAGSTFPIDGTVTLNWGIPTCSPTSCGTVTYDVYYGGTKTGGGTAVATCAAISPTTCTASIADLIASATSTTSTQFYIYANTGCGESELDGSSYLIACQCGEAPNITSMTTLPSASPLCASDVTIAGKFSDADSHPYASNITLTLYYGNATGTYQFPQTKVICSPTGTQCTSASAAGQESSFSTTIPKEVVQDDIPFYWGVSIEDELGLESGTQYPPGFDKTSDKAAQITDCTVSPYLDFAAGKEPYPNTFPFSPTGNNRVVIGFETLDKAAVTMRVFAPDGTLIKIVGDNPADPSAFDFETVTKDECNWGHGCSWDGADYRGGALVANGLYFIHILATGTSDSKYPGQTIEVKKGIVIMK